MACLCGGRSRDTLLNASTTSTNATATPKTIARHHQFRRSRGGCARVRCLRGLIDDSRAVAGRGLNSRANGANGSWRCSPCALAPDIARGGATAPTVPSSCCADASSNRLSEARKDILVRPYGERNAFCTPPRKCARAASGADGPRHTPRDWFSHLSQSPTSLGEAASAARPSSLSGPAVGP